MDSLPWERRPDESSRAYQAFSVYRDMGVHRSLRKAADLFYAPDDPEGARRAQVVQLERWSVEYGWVARSEAYDAHLERQRREQAEEAVRAMADRHARLAVAMLTKAAERLQSLDVRQLDPHDVVRFATEAAKLERQARGQATELIEHRVDPETQRRQAEQQAEIIATVLRAAIDELGLPSEQQDQARAVVRRHLVALAGGADDDREAS